MRDLVHTLATSSATPDNGLKIAIVTAISVVLAAAITGLATTVQKRRAESGQPKDTTQDFISDLLRRNEVMERRNSLLEARAESLSKNVDRLEGYCWRNGIDPNNGQPVPPPTNRDTR